MRAGIFTIILILAYLFFEDILSGVGSASSLVYVALMVLLMMPLFFFGSRLKNKDRTVEYKKRTENTINELLTTGVLSNVPPSNSSTQSFEARVVPENIDNLTVFLRPFAADQVEVRNPDLNGVAATWIPLYKFVLPSAVTLDDGLRYTLAASSKLVAISSAVGHIGAATISRTDENWKQAFEDLVPRANLILVVPGDRKGTQWEIHRLVQLRLLPKCLFIFFPLPMMIKYEASEAFEFESVKAMLAECGLRVPAKTTAGDEISVGDALVFGDSGSIVVHGSKVVTQGLISSELNISRIKKCLKLMLAK